MNDINGNKIQHGSVIRWHVWDSDDQTTWTFTGLLIDHTNLTPPFKSDVSYVVYLGGGVDFGSAIGSKLETDEVIAQSESSDYCGIEVIGSKLEIVRHIAN